MFLHAYVKIVKSRSRAWLFVEKYKSNDHLKCKLGMS